MLLSVVVNRFGPLDLESRVNFGKLCRPRGNAGLDGQVSTTMFQSVISIDSMMSLRLRMVHHGTTTSIFFAVMNGRSAGLRPSIVRSSTTKTPGVSLEDNRPM